MPDPHDPFPMRSAQAVRLASSVSDPIKENNGKSNSSVWSKMSTTTDAPSPSLISSKLDQNKESLTTNSIDEDDKSESEISDGYLDRPHGKKETILQSLGTSVMSIITYLYGPISIKELLRVLVLSLTLFFMIGSYWLLRSLKDPILTAFCGVEAIPKAKMMSVAVVLLVVTVYNYLLDKDIPKHQLFYCFGTFYFILFSYTAHYLNDPSKGLQNEISDPSRYMGWVTYCAIESFGSVMVSLFWSFANSNIGLESAKASYGLLVATAQIGSIIGPGLVNSHAEDWGVPALFAAGALGMLLLQGSMYLYVFLYGAGRVEEQPSSVKKKSKAGILEGLHLFWDHHYIKGIFAISCLFMVEVTIIDFTMKVLARDHFSMTHPCLEYQSCWDSTLQKPGGMSSEATAAFTTFMGLFGQATNMCSFFLSLFGTSAVIRTLGLRITLLLFPTICLASIVYVRFNPTLYSVFGVMILLKASSYALNNPTKEILYQPTSPAVKYKAKSWIDIFGARGSKALGSVVTNAFSDSASDLIQNGSLVGMSVAAFLIWNARYVGRTFESYMEKGYVVGDTSEDGEGIHMAIGQNEEVDTSCAIEEDLSLDDGSTGHDLREMEGQEEVELEVTNLDENEEDDDAEEDDDDEDDEDDEDDDEGEFGEFVEKKVAIV